MRSSTPGRTSSTPRTRPRRCASPAPPDIRRPSSSRRRRWTSSRRSSAAARCCRRSRRTSIRSSSMAWCFTGSETDMVKIRKMVTIVEEILSDGGREARRPVRRAAAVVVLETPCAGRFVDALTPLVGAGEERGALLAKKATEALGAPAESYGKAAIVGEQGEYEHAAALLHPKLGAPLRAAVGGGKAIIPSAKKLGGPGTGIDVPLHFKDAAFVRTHYDAMEVRIPDAPRANEIVLAIVVTDGGRPHPRIGGLTKDEARKEDGQR